MDNMIFPVSLKSTSPFNIHYISNIDDYLKLSWSYDLIFWSGDGFQI